MTCLRRRSYGFGMSDPPLSRRDIYAAAAAHDELGPEYSDAVVASFLKKVDKEIDARVDARLAGMRQPAPPAARDHLRTLLKGAAAGIGPSGISFFLSPRCWWLLRGVESPHAGGLRSECIGLTPRLIPGAPRVGKRGRTACPLPPSPSPRQHGHSSTPARQAKAGLYA